MLNNAVNIDGRWKGRAEAEQGQGRGGSRAGIGRGRREESECCVGVGKFDKLDEMAASLSLSLSLSHSVSWFCCCLSVGSSCRLSATRSAASNSIFKTQNSVDQTALMRCSEGVASAAAWREKSFGLL